MKRYFRVKAKCGHVGNNKYIPIDFFYYAETAKEAAVLCRAAPRVKHHQKDAIIETVEITKEEYEVGMSNNRNDPYLNSKNIQEQRKNISSIINRVQNEKDSEGFSSKGGRKVKSDFVFHNEAVKNPKKFLNNYVPEDLLLEEIQGDPQNAIRRYCSSVTRSNNQVKKVQKGISRDMPLGEVIFSIIKDEQCESPEVFLKKLRVFFRNFYVSCSMEDSVEFGLTFAYYISILERVSERSDNGLIEDAIVQILEMIDTFRDKLDLEYFENWLADFKAYNFHKDISEEMFAKQISDGIKNECLYYD